MKRQIKFRGKEIQTGEWVYGYYTQGAFIDPTTGEETVRHLIHADHIYDVEEDTVGQFTGLQDSKGNDIYEGDIIESDHKIIHEIYYQEIDARFMAACDGNRKFLSGGVTQNWIDEFNKVVIGNIHDNPELLKGGEK